MLRPRLLLMSTPGVSPTRDTTPAATSSPGVRIRPAVARDLPGVEALLSANALPLAGVREALSRFVVAEDEHGTIVGVAGLEVYEQHALLRSVAVAAEWRSHGLGRALVERIIAEANARGLQSIHLLTTTADRYFPSFGFEKITRDEVPACLRVAEEFASACPASATVMRLMCGEKTQASNPR